jgi:hypothetical protein
MGVPSGAAELDVIDLDVGERGLELAGPAGRDKRASCAVQDSTCHNLSKVADQFTSRFSR